MLRTPLLHPPFTYRLPRELVQGDRRLSLLGKEQNVRIPSEGTEQDVRIPSEGTEQDARIPTKGTEQDDPILLEGTEQEILTRLEHFQGMETSFSQTR